MCNIPPRTVRMIMTLINMTFACVHIILYASIFIFSAQTYYQIIGYLATCHLILNICILIVGIIICCRRYSETFVAGFVIAINILGFIASVFGIAIGSFYIQTKPFYIYTKEFSMIVVSISLVFNILLTLMFVCPAINYIIHNDDD